MLRRILRSSQVVDVPDADVAAAQVVIKRALVRSGGGPENSENGLKNKANSKEEDGDYGDEEEDGEQDECQKQQQDDIAAAGADIGSEGFEVIPHGVR